MMGKKHYLLYTDSKKKTQGIIIQTMKLMCFQLC